MKMPRYVYECLKCGGQFKTVHGINEVQDHCDFCFSGDCLRRIPQMTFTSKPESKESKNVKQAIEENRQILKDSIKETKGKEYDG